ncbi:hypothetical protein AX17_002540 [Amanita inopinata Kibby_2008]|nr:hypothetical protein AX17_002540 [Amanita inopinata Kibby_2008]
MTRKRLRITHAGQAVGVVDSATPKKDLLKLLPVELLTQVLIYSGSTRHILAVARCSKHLCQILVEPANAHIWRKTRRQHPICPMPDPPKGLTEPAYAAFVFDGGKCDICQGYTKEMYSSFAIRFRVCMRKTCQHYFSTREFKGLVLVGDDPFEKRIRGAIPAIESDWCIATYCTRRNYSRFYMRWPNSSPFCRIKVCQEAQERWFYLLESENIGSNQQLIDKYRAAAQKNQEWMKFCVALCQWKRDYKKQRGIHKYENYNTLLGIADQKGYGLENFELTSYGQTYFRHNKNLELLDKHDYEATASKVEVELLELVEKHRRRKREVSYKSNLEVLKTHYHHLRSKTPRIILPPFSTFLRFPIVAFLLELEAAQGRASLSGMLEGDSNEIQTLIRSELVKWEAFARNQLSKVLGYNDWVSVSTKVLHPVDRLSARFQCKNCHHVAARYKDLCLDFIGACAHECEDQKGQIWSRESWEPSKFEKDEKVRYYSLR